MSWNGVSKQESWQTAVDSWVRYLDDFGHRAWTVLQYRSEASRFATWAVVEGLEVGEVTRLHVEAYVSHMRKTRGLGGRSVAARLAALRSFFDWALRHDLCVNNPARAVPNPRFRKPLPQVMTSDQLAVLLDLPLRDGDGFKARRDAALLRTLAWTGIRVSEAHRLDWDHFDLTPARSTLRVVDSKGGKDRVVPVNEPLCQTLLSYLELRLPLGSRRAVWVGERSDRLAVRTIRDIVASYGDRIGIRLTPHRLRAQCGVEMIRQGATLPEVRVVLGHAAYDTLLPYTAVAAEEARGALERIGQAATRSSRSSGSQQSDGARLRARRSPSIPAASPNSDGSRPSGET